MELLYKQEHLNCIHYDSGVETKPQIEIKTISKGQPFEGYSSQSEFVFMLEGSAAYRLRGLSMIELNEGQILTISPDKQFSISTKTSAKLLVIRITKTMGLCECFPLENLLCFRKEDSRDVTLLEINPAIEAFIIGLSESLEQGLRCKYYLETKTKELFYLFRAYYPKEQLAQFLSDILHADAYFYYFVKENYLKAGSIPEFAKMMDMKQLAFDKKFKEVFGVPPYKWIIQQKIRNIHHALCTENTPLNNLAVRFGFSSKSSFNDFCKKNLGVSPGRIRKGTHPVQKTK